MTIRMLNLEFVVDNSVLILAVLHYRYLKQQLLLPLAVDHTELVMLASLELGSHFVLSVHLIPLQLKTFLELMLIRYFHM